MVTFHRNLQGVKLGVHKLLDGYFSS